MKTAAIMFDELNKYKTHGHFFFTPTDSLEEVCNAPDDMDGVYIVYQLKGGHVDLVYIGTSGIYGTTYPKDGLFGLKRCIINGIPSANETGASRAWLKCYRKILRLWIFTGTLPTRLT